MGGSIQFVRKSFTSSTVISVDLRNCKKAIIQNVGKSSIYLGSTDATLADSQPEMFTLLPPDNDAYKGNRIVFENPNQLFDGPLFCKVSTTSALDFIEIAKFGCV
jgi:hypothetical protein